MLAKSQKLNLGKGENRRIFSGNKIKTESLTIYFQKAKENHSRFLVIVPKKIINKAVDRNRIKRQLYSLIRSFLKDLEGLDAVVYVDKKDRGCENYTQSLLEALKKLYV